jgi:molybdopterin synthase sulfur carrier subunit
MKILYFAWLRERVGLTEEDVTLPAHITDIAGLITWQRDRGPGFAAAFAPGGTVRCAVDQEFAGHDTSIAGAREVAFFPPVTGG